MLQHTLGRLPPREVNVRRLCQASHPRSVLVWSDAMWEEAEPHRPAAGGLGFVVFFPPGHRLGGARGRFCYAHLRVSLADLAHLRFSRDHHLIGQLELLACAAVYASFPVGTFDGLDVIHFVDNTGALFGLVKGYSGAPDMHAIIRAFHVTNLVIRANLWFNYVASKANVADLPSRGALLEMANCLREVDPAFDLAEGLVPLVIPACPRDITSLWETVVSQFPDMGPEPPPAPPRRHARGGKRPRG